MILPAQFANEVREGDKTLFCSYCSRILFYQESDDSEEDYYAMSEAGSLSDFEDDFADEKLDDEDYGDDGYNDKSDYDDEDVDDEDSDDEKDDSDEDDSDEN